MKEGLIKNLDQLKITPNRELVLEIIEAGFGSINTARVVNSSISLVGDILFVQDKEFDLTKYHKIKVVGFGKSSGEAAQALEKILESKITQGAVNSLHKIPLKYIESFAGTHPRATEANVRATKQIIKILENSNENDLIIVLITGGGSALLCGSETELEQGNRLYDSFLSSGKRGIELNIVRKHLSILKGGGLAKLAYPATVLGLVFSDVPGEHFEYVASGPTYKDITTTFDAEKIIKENSLGVFDLIETPKEDKYFEKVHNFILVSNKIALKAMAEKARNKGLETEIISTELYDKVDEALAKIFSYKKENLLVLAGGEPRIVVKNTKGKGGRNLHMALSVINKKLIDDDSVFVSFASDGMDNTDIAGAVVDKNTIDKIEKLGLNIGDYLEKFDSYAVFEKSGDLILTGPTGANVSDLIILITKKQ